jgi:hypothetical protein
LKLGRLAHYLISILAGIVSFFFSYAAIQYLITRNLIESLLPGFILNFSFAGFMSGAVYAISFRRGRIMLALAPAIIILGCFQILAVLQGEIGYISKTMSPLEFTIPVVLGILCAYIGSKIVQKITMSHS